MPALSAADYAYWDRERQEYGYLDERGRWFACDAMTENGPTP
jgi:hypothetical protein